MSTNYPPGTVALVADPVEGERVAIFIGDGGDQPCWHMADGDGVLRCLAADAAESIRPLVVIDPEDREQVERIYPPNWVRENGQVDFLQQHLRNLVAPKPAEPTGLGAVVEAGNGDRWVRIEAGGGKDALFLWICEADEDAKPRPWSSVAAVRVLSEGVQA